MSLLPAGPDLQGLLNDCNTLVMRLLNTFRVSSSSWLCTQGSNDLGLRVVQELLPHGCAALAHLSCCFLSYLGLRENGYSPRMVTGMSNSAILMPHAHFLEQSGRTCKILEQPEFSLVLSPFVISPKPIANSQASSTQRSSSWPPLLFYL